MFNRWARGVVQSGAGSAGASVHPYTASVLDSNPEVFWTMSGDEGTTMADLMGNHDATYNGTPNFAITSPVYEEGNAVEMGSGDWMTTPLPMQTLYDAGAFTVEMWLKHYSAGQTWSFAWGGSILDCGGDPWWQFTKVSGSSEIRWETGDWMTSDVNTSGASFGNSTWKHVVARYDGAQKIVRVDGVNVGSVNQGLGGYRNYGNFIFGVQQYSCGNSQREWWNGGMAACAIYLHAVDFAETDERAGMVVA